MSKKALTIALAGNANVGKSVIFNHLTGLHQHTGNWPGKTVEKAEGTLHFKGHTVDIIDLPGIYSLSPFSLEEQISREYIAVERPDLVINVLDASVLERNLFFTLQLMELETPMVLALNQMDMAQSKGITIDCAKLTRILGVPVVPTLAIKGVGIYELLDEAVQVAEKRLKPPVLPYGEEVEKRILRLTESLYHVPLRYPRRYSAIQLLQRDNEVEAQVRAVNPEALAVATRLAQELEAIHGHPCSTIITSERYDVARQITQEVQQVTIPRKPLLRETLHTLTTHRLLGYPLMMGVLLVIFFTVFTVGDFLAGVINDFFTGWQPLFDRIFGEGIVGSILWGGVIEGVLAGVTIALPYITPFYILLYLLEDSGYLSRIAFLMDNLMHVIGLHGKAFIPLLLGYGCNVPACLGCRIMETERERLIAGFVSTLVPCAARTVIILGLVGTYLGIQWALALYVFNLAVIFALGRIAYRALPEEPVALIMEMSDYRVPHLPTVAKQTWFRLSEFLKISFPLIIGGSIAVKLLEEVNLLTPVGTLLSPITVDWLGLPAATSITFVFGVLRKELTLIMLATLLGTTNFALALTPLQMLVFTLVAIFYVPCISTIAALIREFGWKNALFMTGFEIVFAIALGGVAVRLLPAFGLP